MGRDLQAGRQAGAEPVLPRARDAAGACYVALAAALTGAGVFFALRGEPLLWLIGQTLLAAALLQWFSLMHECGHGTLFEARLANRLAGHAAGFFCLIPYATWTRVHTLHHRWTGWQDLDPTTASLVPRPLGAVERRVVNGCWKYWVPLFSVLYRVQNFWNLPRLARFFPRPADRRVFALNAAALGCAYVALLAVAGPGGLARVAGVALLACLVLQDPLLLSQHTHVPMRLAGGRKVRPFSPCEQQVYTRSIRLPRWVSAFLLHVDAHELHHAHVRVPGYALGRLAPASRNEEPWWDWLRRAKRVSGEVFLFQNRATSGLEL